MRELPNDKQLKLLILINKNSGMTANHKNRVYYNYPSTFRALETMVSKGLLKKKKNLTGERIYIITDYANNLLVALGYKEQGEFIIK